MHEEMIKAIVVFCSKWVINDYKYSSIGTYLYHLLINNDFCFIHIYVFLLLKLEQ